MNDVRKSGGGGQEKADTCGHWGEEVERKCTSTFNCLIMIVVRIITPESIDMAYLIHGHICHI